MQSFARWKGAHTAFYCCAIVCVMVFAAACSHQTAEQWGARPEETGSFHITISSGGGFTGMVTGYTLSSDGRLTQWQRHPSGGDSVLHETHVDPRQVATFKGDLEKAGMFTYQLNGTGNVTRYVTFSTSDTTYRWSWPAGAPSTKVPSKVVRWFHKIETFCKQAVDSKRH